MKLRHEATVVIPHGATVANLIDALSAFKEVPTDAKVTVTKSSRQFDQRDNSSWGGETTIKAVWES